MLWHLEFLHRNIRYDLLLSAILHCEYFSLRGGGWGVGEAYYHIIHEESLTNEYILLQREGAFRKCPKTVAMICEWSHKWQGGVLGNQL